MDQEKQSTTAGFKPCGRRDAAHPAALTCWYPLEGRNPFAVQMQNAGGKLSAFDVHHTKARRAWEGFEGLRDLGYLEAGRRRGQHSQAIPLDFLIQMDMAADHQAHVG